MVKRTISITLALILILSTVFAMSVPVSAASNTWDPDNGVYNITTIEDLLAFNQEFSKEQDDGEYYKGVTVNLLADITLPKGTKWQCAPANKPMGSSDERYFCGIFNGNNHTISNLDMVSTDESTVSFLPFLGGATIKDLTLKDVQIEYGSTWNAPFSCGSLGDDIISNCHITGNCTINPYNNTDGNNNGYTSGIVATKYSGTLKIENCTVGDEESKVILNDPKPTTYTSPRVISGILGYLDVDCRLEITSTDNYADICYENYSGGFIGFIDGEAEKPSFIKITDCRNYGDMYVNEASDNYGMCFCAGFVGYENPDSVLVIDRCANHGDITMNCDTCYFSCAGVGAELGCASILNTYNTGRIEANPSDISVGGLIAHFRVNDNFILPETDFFDYYPDDYFNSIINCYNVGDVIASQSNYVGGVCGYIQDYYTTEKRSVIKNAYSFGQVSGQEPTGSVCGCNQDTAIEDVYGQSDSYALGGIEINSGNPEGPDSYISKIGYFDTPDVSGTVYPATVKAKGVGLHTDTIIETISSTPLSSNLLSLLNEKVSEYNAELEASGSAYRYLTWKMTNPASEDGYKGTDVHPMFGIQEFDVNFYANFAENEEPFRTYTAADLVMGKVPVFYDLPAHEGYIFKGWYLDKENNDDDSPISFDTIYTASTDIYAHWIKVENVDKNADDPSILPGGGNTYGGFDLAGVQIRKEMRDYNFDDVPKKPGGMRFITSLSMDVVNEINAIKPNNIEYGYVAATHEGWIEYHSEGVAQGLDEKLKYVSETANGIDTSSAEATNENYFGFAHNVKCTSRVANSQNNEVRVDHQNFGDYLLYSFVVTYEGDDAARKDTNVLARPYIHYTDANGLERVAYSEYTGASNVLGGCYTNYNTVAAKAGN